MWTIAHIMLQIKFTLTHCILNKLSHIMYWKGPISILGMSGYEIYIFLEKNGWTICKQWRPWSDATFCGIWSGFALFANYPFRGSPRLQWVNNSDSLNPYHTCPKIWTTSFYHNRQVNVFNPSPQAKPEYVLPLQTV